MLQISSESNHHSFPVGKLPFVAWSLQLHYVKGVNDDGCFGHALWRWWHAVTGAHSIQNSSIALYSCQSVALYTHKSSEYTKSHEWSSWSSWSVSVTYMKVFCAMSSLREKGIIQAYKQFLGHRFSWKHDAIISSENSWNLGSHELQGFGTWECCLKITHLCCGCLTKMSSPCRLLQNRIIKKNFHTCMITCNNIYFSIAYFHLL